MRDDGLQLRPTIETVPVLLWAAGPDRRCFFFNERWVSFTGRISNQRAVQDWIEDVHREDRARCAAAYAAAFARREEFQFECRLRHKDGVYRRAIASGAPRFTPAGEFAGFVGAVIDVHELASTHEDEDAAGKRSTIGSLAAGIAHDVNNLLGTILANAELALSEIGAPSPAAAELERIRTVAVRGSEIVRELMVYAGREQAKAECVDISKLVQEMLEMLRISVTKHARITTDLTENPPPIVAEPAELRELLMNLILNASDALGGHDGEIRISTSHVADGSDPEVAGTAGSVRLAVRDTGSGIARSVRGRLFDAFVSTKRPGRGVGLAIVRRIARKYGGNVRFTSTLGRGTEFEVLLPCASKPMGTAEPQSAGAAAVSGAGRVVLLVDDEPGLRLAVSHLLRRDGFRVLEAGDGSSAVELLRTHGRNIDVVLLDLTVPGLPSEKVVKVAQRIHPDVRILLTSAYERGSAAPVLKNRQVKGFLRKPYLIGDLLRVLGEELWVDANTGGARRE
jgi:two-component system cell cycle sensor histidine kinase/response regulator CckA